MSIADDFRAAVEARDTDAVMATLGDEVVFHSPVSFKPFSGRDAVGHVLATVAEVFEDFVYTDHLRSGGTSALVFRARVGDRLVEGIDLIREGGDGQIVELTVLVRPLSGLVALGEEMGRRLGPGP